MKICQLESAGRRGEPLAVARHFVIKTPHRKFRLPWEKTSANLLCLTKDDKPACKIQLASGR